MSQTLRLIAYAAATSAGSLLAALCGCSTSEPPAANTDAGADGSPFSLDNTLPEVPVSVSGSDGEFQVVARLASPGGKRRIVLVRGKEEEEVAPADWNLPPVAIKSLTPGADLHAIVVCWDVLTGAEPAPDQMPQPRSGLELRCRYRPPTGGFGAVINAGFGAPSWLRTVGVDLAGMFSVEILRDGAGTLFGAVTAGDGLYRTKISNGRAEAPVLVQAR